MSRRRRNAKDERGLCRMDRRCGVQVRRKQVYGWHYDDDCDDDDRCSWQIRTFLSPFLCVDVHCAHCFSTYSIYFVSPKRIVAL